MSGNTKSLTRSTDKDLVGVQFHGARLIAVRGETPETTMVAMRPVVEGMGIDWASQFKRLRRHPVLQTCVVKMTMQMPGDESKRSSSER